MVLRRRRRLVGGAVGGVVVLCLVYCLLAPDQYEASAPRTLLIEIRFRSKDPALAAAVVNELIRGFMAVESQTRMEATSQASGWLAGQLKELTAQVEVKERRLAEFERQHGFTTTQQTVP